MIVVTAEEPGKAAFHLYPLSSSNLLRRLRSPESLGDEPLHLSPRQLIQFSEDESTDNDLPAARVPQTDKEKKKSEKKRVGAVRYLMAKQ